MVLRTYILNEDNSWLVDHFSRVVRATSVLLIHTSFNSTTNGQEYTWQMSYQRSSLKYNSSSELDLLHLHVFHVQTGAIHATVAMIVESDKMQRKSGRIGGRWQQCEHSNYNLSTPVSLLIHWASSCRSQPAIIYNTTRDQRRRHRSRRSFGGCVTDNSEPKLVPVNPDSPPGDNSQHQHGALLPTRAY